MPSSQAYTTPSAARQEAKIFILQKFNLSAEKLAASDGYIQLISKGEL